MCLNLSDFFKWWIPKDLNRSGFISFRNTSDNHLSLQTNNNLREHSFSQILIFALTLHTVYISWCFQLSNAFIAASSVHNVVAGLVLVNACVPKQDLLVLIFPLRMRLLVLIAFFVIKRPEVKQLVIAAWDKPAIVFKPGDIVDSFRVPTKIEIVRLLQRVEFVNEDTHAIHQSEQMTAIGKLDLHAVGLGNFMIFNQVVV